MAPVSIKKHKIGCSYPFNRFNDCAPFPFPGINEMRQAVFCAYLPCPVRAHFRYGHQHIVATLPELLADFQDGALLVHAGDNNRNLGWVNHGIIELLLPLCRMLSCFYIYLINPELNQSEKQIKVITKVKCSALKVIDLLICLKLLLL